MDVALTSGSMAELSATKVLIDTGATVHAIRRTGGPTRTRILDAHGAPMGADRLDASPIAGVSGPWFGVTGLPVAAVVSPQAMLAPGQCAELDFRGGHFRVWDDPRDGATAIARAKIRAVTARCPGLWIANASLGGHDVRLLVDTGSVRTTLLLRSPTTPAFRKWRNYPATMRLPSGNHAAWVVLDVPIAVAGLETNLDLVVADDPDEPCDIDGTLGMDVLARCDVVVMRASAGLTCE